MERTIKPDVFISSNNVSTVVLDVRRDNDYNASGDIVPGAQWKDPTKIDDWITSAPKDKQAVIYCVRGGVALATAFLTAYTPMESIHRRRN
jgi:hypothetical protein